MTNRLIQLSGITTDLIYKVEKVPEAGSEARVLGFEITAGGGINAMVAARRAGMRVDYAGSLGTGPFSDIANEILSSEGIGMLRPRLIELDQGCCTVLVDNEGERTFIASPGADGIVRRTDIACVCPDAGDWVLLSGYALQYAGSRDAIRAWLESPPIGLNLIFDVCPIIGLVEPQVRQLALETASWITANQKEAEVLSGLTDPVAAASKLLRIYQNAGGVLVRVGEQGCFIAQPGKPVERVKGYCVETIDTNGAGDTHTGTFIALIAKGEPPIVAAKIANISAALSTTREGPSTAPYLNEVLIKMRNDPLFAVAE